MSQTIKTRSNFSKNWDIFSLWFWQNWRGQFFLATLHGGAGSYMAYEAATNPDRGKANIFIVQPTIVASLPDGMPLIDFSTNKVVDTWNLWLMNCVFLFWTMSFHLLYGGYMLKRIYYDKNFDEEKNLSISINLRWLEYFSASIMVMIVAILCGIRELYLLISLAALMWVTMDYGMAEEFFFRNKIKVPWYVSPGFKGGFPFMVVWTILFVEFYRAIRESENQTGNLVPTFVKIIIANLFIFYFLFWWVHLFYLKLQFSSWFWLLASPVTFILGKLSAFAKSIINLISFGCLCSSKRDYERTNTNDNFTLSDDQIDVIFQRMDGAYHLLSLFSKLFLAIFIGLGLNGVIE